VRRCVPLTLGAALALAAPALLAGSADVALTRAVVAGGGSRSAGGSFVLVGTLGQPAAGLQAGGAFRLSGGFHVEGNASVPAAAIFGDGFEG
jgi:hypothetical protein